MLREDQLPTKNCYTTLHLTISHLLFLQHYTFKYEDSEEKSYDDPDHEDADLGENNETELDDEDDEDTDLENDDAYLKFI